MWESAEATVEPSGRVVIRSGSSPHGQGHETTFAQIAADRLGVSIDDVVLRFGDSAEVPRGIGTFASRSTAMGGSAIVLALDRIVARARAVAAHLLDAEEDAVAFDAGRFSAGGGSVTLREVAAAAYEPARLPAGRRCRAARLGALPLAAALLVRRVRRARSRSTATPASCASSTSPASTTAAT